MDKVIAIVGPTGVGKTKLSVEIAKKFNGEIINCDAFQVYKKLDIGTAKATKEEQQSIKHHLLDFLEPDESFSVAGYQRLAREKIEEVKNSGKLPIIVGGSGMYIQAVLYDYNFSASNRDENFAEEYKNLSNENLHLKLLKIDNLSANKIHPNNRKRVLRALEIALAGKNKSELEEEQRSGKLYDTLILGLNLEREKLYDRINERVDDMISNGLEKEVRNLFDELSSDSQSLSAIGYKEWLSHFSDEMTKDEVIEKIKQNSRRYAKRQFTYFRNRMEVSWIDVNIDNFGETIKKGFDLVVKFLGV